MRARLIAATLLLAVAGCASSGPVPNPATPNGDVTKRPGVAPDTPANKAPKPGFKDNAVDTDPSAPRTRDKNQKIEVPTLSGE